MPEIGLIFKFGEAHKNDKKYLGELKEVPGMEDLKINILDWRYQPDKNQANFFDNMDTKHINYVADEFCKEQFNKKLSELTTDDKKKYKDKFSREIEEDAKQYYKYTNKKTLDEAVEEYINQVDAIFIPGGAYDPIAEFCDNDHSRTPPDIRRETFERALVKKAIERGIPVLGICAGSWLVASCFEGIKTKALDVALEKKHNQDTKIIRDETEIQTIRMPIHPVDIKAGTMLFGIFDNAKGFQAKKQDTKYLKQLQKKSTASNDNNFSDKNAPLKTDVNSTHWRVVIAQDKNGKIDNNNLLVISAIEPTDLTIEAFETKYGVPIMGIQFHPEYRIPMWITKNKIEPDLQYPENRRVLEAFAQSAKAHEEKQKMLQELKLSKKFNDQYNEAEKHTTLKK